MIYMTHPKHGAHNFTGGEVAEAEKNGWVRSVHGSLLTKKEAVIIEDKPAIIEAREEPKRKPGRPFNKHRG